MQREVRAESGDISIHALRKESDPPQKQEGQHNDPISIHALRKESDLRTARPYQRREISIHALRKESDALASRHAWVHGNFNPRSP